MMAGQWAALCDTNSASGLGSEAVGGSCCFRSQQQTQACPEKSKFHVGRVALSRDRLLVWSNAILTCPAAKTLLAKLPARHST